MKGIQNPAVQSGPNLRALLIALVVTIPISGLLAFGLTRDPRAIPSPLVGRPAPTFMLRLFDGGVIDTETLRGRILIVNFWASWCFPTCHEEAPRLQRVWERYRECDVIVIGVNIQDSEAAAQKFIRQSIRLFRTEWTGLGRPASTLESRAYPRLSSSIRGVVSAQSTLGPSQKGG